MNSDSNYSNKYEIKIKFSLKDLFKLNILDISNILDILDENEYSKLLLGKILTLKLFVKKYTFTNKVNDVISGYQFTL